MRACTEGQRRLHPSLVGSDAQRVIDAVAARGALGWKVNGAGGEGGSLAVLSPSDDGERAAIEAAIGQASSVYQVLPTTIAPVGLRVEFARCSAGEVNA
jgi:D-glycero-alpha-D-manno-heptose-7-phosphate kinase